MNIYFIGCLHFGHNGVARHRGFEDSQAHDEHLIQQWNSVVKKNDIVYILGDITMEKSFWYYQLDRLNGTKHVILGNHDRRQDVPELLKYVATVGGALKHKGYMLTHIPMHPNEVHLYRGNIHAHIHHESKLEEVRISNDYQKEGSLMLPTLNKYFNVDAHVLNYKPVTLEQLTKNNDSYSN